MFLNPWYSNNSAGAVTSVTSSPTQHIRSTQNKATQSPRHSPATPKRKVPAPPPPAPVPPVDAPDDSGVSVSDDSTRENDQLPSRTHPNLEWTSHTTSEGRIYYCNHESGSSSWIPPISYWNGLNGGLPYGLEAAYDTDGKEYFINHLTQQTSYEDPRKYPFHPDEATKPRDVVLVRDQEFGFGFVAGSQRPVIIRFVTEGGPSVTKLLAGDQILSINGEDVQNAPREHVIQLIRSCKDTVQLTVSQPPQDNKKSNLMSAAKKAKLKSNPSRVRFAEGVVINGSATAFQQNNSQMNGDDQGAIQGGELCLPLLPNVLKVFLENGQTKSFKYDQSTTVSDVIESLREKLAIKCIQHFALVVEHIKSLKRNKLTLLDPDESLAKIASEPGAHLLRCLFRVTFVPKDASDLLKEDPITFDYLYTQCCNDVCTERFSPELKYEIALRLAALQISQHAMANNMNGKISIKTIEKEFGLERFVPSSLVDNVKRKELRKLLNHFLKSNNGLVPSGQKSLTPLQAKLHYLRIIGELPSYGAKCFPMNLHTDSDTYTEHVLLVSPKFGISQIRGTRNSLPEQICEIENVISVEATREDELSFSVEIIYKSLENPEETFGLGLEEREAEELILFLKGYYFLLNGTGQELRVLKERNYYSQTPENAPPYHSIHSVQPAPWSYSQSSTDLILGDSGQYLIDLRETPPFKPSEMRSFHLQNHQNQHHQTSSPRLTPRHLSIPADLNQKKLNSTTTTYLDSNMNMNTSYAHMQMYEDENDGFKGGGNLNEEELMIISVKNPPSNNNNNNHQQSRAGILKNPAKRNSSTQFNRLNLPTTNGFDFNSSSSVHETFYDERNHVNKMQRVDERVADMKRLVEDAERYLTDQGSDTGSMRSSLSDESHNFNCGQFHHHHHHHHTNCNNNNVISQRKQQQQQQQQNIDRDSGAESQMDQDSPHLFEEEERDLNLAVEEIRAMSIFEEAEAEPSESDTDSINSPTQTPITHIKSAIKTSDSSFGLHSPDTFPNSIYQDFQGRSSEEVHKEKDFGLYFDPDIIDLTLIPPPLTPDEDTSKSLPSQFNAPPTPFADKLNPVLEFKIFKGPPGEPSGPRTHNLTQSDLDFIQRVPSGFEGNFTPNEKADGEGIWRYQDIDSFISMTTLPPPPSAFSSASSSSSSSNSINQPIQQHQVPYLNNNYNRRSDPSEDITSLIIPPPPCLAYQSSSSSGDDDQVQNDTSTTYQYNSNNNNSPPGDTTKISPKIALIQSQLKFQNQIQDQQQQQQQSRNHPIPYPANKSQYHNNVVITESPSKFSPKRQHTNSFSINMNQNNHNTNANNNISNTNTFMSNDDDDGSKLSIAQRRAIFLGLSSGENNSQNSPSHQLKVFELPSPPLPPPLPQILHHSSTTTTNTPAAEFHERKRRPNSSDHQQQQVVILSNNSNGGSRSFSSSTLGNSPFQPRRDPKIFLEKKNDFDSPLLDHFNETGDSSAGILESLEIEPLSNATYTTVRATQRHPIPQTQKTPPSPLKQHSSNMRHNSTSTTQVGPISGSRVIEINQAPASPQLTPKSCLKKKISPNWAAGDREPETECQIHVESPIKIIERTTKEEQKSSIIETTTTAGGNGHGQRPGNINWTLNSPSKMNGNPGMTSQDEHRKYPFGLMNGSLKRISISNHSSDNSSTNFFKAAGDPISIEEKRNVQQSSELSTNNSYVIPYGTVDDVLCRIVQKLEDIITQCGIAHANGGGIYMNPTKFQTSKDALGVQARQMVGASKLLVMSVTAGEAQNLLVVKERLENCVTILDQIVEISEDVVHYTSTPLQTQNLIIRAKSSAHAFRILVQAAAQFLERKSNEDKEQMEKCIFERGTLLAADLSALLRTARVFN